MNITHPRQNTIRDLLIITTIPAILAAIYYLTPSTFQQLLALDHTNPELHAFWTNALVHNHKPGDTHLLSNIGTYLLLVPLTWYIHTHCNQNRRFWTAFTLIILITPVIATTSGYLVFHERVGTQLTNDRGYSGVVAAFAGYLLMTILTTFWETQDHDLAWFATGLYFGVLFIGIGVVTNRYWLLGTGLLLLIGQIVTGERGYTVSPDRLADWGSDYPVLSQALILAVFGTTFALAGALPSEIITAEGQLTNIVAHGTGIVCGLGVDGALQRSRWAVAGGAGPEV